MATYSVMLACTVFGNSGHAALPIQVLTIEQLDNTASSPVPPRAIKHHRAHRDVLADASKSPPRLASSRDDEFGDPIASFARETSVSGRGIRSQRRKTEILASGVAAGFYRVNPGDTITRIATQFGRQPTDLMNWNSLTSNSLLQPGRVLRVGPPVEARFGGAAR
ncbi:LysM peptidoglycan-binding domain-containing protein [Burkholderia sp. Ac-20345]|nr:LysM peptidoglycan-binding domain-containing protein [Burkholderia sp. Ac-20345]